MGDKRMYWARRVMRVCHYIGGSVMFVGLLFAIQHWPWAYDILLVANVFAVLFWFSSTLELVWSKNINGNTKYVWGIMLALVTIIAAVFYIPLLFLLIQWGYLKQSEKKLYNIITQPPGYHS